MQNQRITIQLTVTFPEKMYHRRERSQSNAVHPYHMWNINRELLLESITQLIIFRQSRDTQKERDYVAQLFTFAN